MMKLGLPLWSFFFFMLGSAEGSYPTHVQSAKMKSEYLWGQCLKTQYTTLPKKGPGPFSMLKIFARKYLAKSYQITGDVLPKKRKKILHPHGAMALGTFVPKAQGHGFTGLFSGGGNLILRVSFATTQKTSAPALSLKYLVDGRPSANMFAMRSLDGQKRSDNIFKFPWHNFTHPPKDRMTKFIDKLGKRAMKVVHKRGVRDEIETLPLASFERDGTPVKRPRAPKYLFFLPLQSLSSGPVDFRQKLETELRPNRPLFKVYGSSAREGRPMTYLGDIRLASKFLSCTFSDVRIFFKHELRVAAP